MYYSYSSINVAIVLASVIITAALPTVAIELASVIIDAALTALELAAAKHSIVIRDSVTIGGTLPAVAIALSSVIIATAASTIAIALASVIIGAALTDLELAAAKNSIVIRVKTRNIVNKVSRIKCVATLTFTESEQSLRNERQSRRCRR